ncbi:DHCW motif cupin fold protein [Kiloniella majae]|uniref:DHCW motif cupin fold protein n=1 Tax=Kiloniella majae TaxID=1938558 RepID=UPI000A278A23|nr:DHCW motif cupin fold protein [Kiloniella majae]
MATQDIPFQTIDWAQIAVTEHPGDEGTAYWQTLQYEGLRIRIVQYSAGYIADHWCEKGHIVQCLEGNFTSELSDGTNFSLSVGMTYVVSDDLSSHRSVTKNGVKLLIIDGDFLKSQKELN